MGAVTLSMFAIPFVITRALASAASVVIIVPKFLPEPIGLFGYWPMFFSGDNTHVGCN